MPIVEQFNSLKNCWENGQKKGFLIYEYVKEDSKVRLDREIEEKTEELNADKKNLQANLKSAEDVSKSFDDIIRLFYEIQKHKREKKDATNSQFGSSKRKDVSANVSSMKQDFFVSKMDVSAVQFCQSLSSVIDSFFGDFLRSSVGIIPLIDAFIEFNKHRGTDVVSSKEFREACTILGNNRKG